jgi:hypothetical protein
MLFSSHITSLVLLADLSNLYTTAVIHYVCCLYIGGLPRPRPGMSQIESIQRVPVAAAVSPPYPCEDPDLTRVAYECLWSDPAKTQVIAFTKLVYIAIWYNC